jgi:hypothetical protein
MKCPNHPEAEADFTCVRCGRQVCAQCIEDVAGQWVCAQCVAAPQASPPGPAQPSGPAPTPPAQPQPWQTPAPPPAVPPPYPPVPPRSGPTALAIVGMVCGIAGLVLCCIPYLSTALSIAGLVMGLITLYSVAPEATRAANRPYAIAAIATGAVGVLVLVLSLAGLAVFGNLMRHYGGRFPMRP